MKPHVLIADDDASVRESLKRLLVGVDYEATTVADGQMVLDQLAKRRFDLLILDLDLPVRNGREVLDSVRHSHPSLPTILISGLTDARSAWGDNPPAVFMEKPIEAAALLDTIAELLANADRPLAGE